MLLFVIFKCNLYTNEIKLSTCDVYEIILFLQFIYIEFPACEEYVGTGELRQFDFRPRFYASGSPVREISVYIYSISGLDTLSG